MKHLLLLSLLLGAEVDEREESEHKQRGIDGIGFSRSLR